MLLLLELALALLIAAANGTEALPLFGETRAKFEVERRTWREVGAHTRNRAEAVATSTDPAPP
jgi:hypothetical protein